MSNANSPIEAFSLARWMPNLSRFAGVLSCDAQSSAALLQSCETYASANSSLLAQHPDPRHQLFSHIYATWVDELGQRAPFSVKLSHGPDAKFLCRLGANNAQSFSKEAEETCYFIASQPAQQRAALLLVYGEAMNYEETADILASPSDFIVQIIAASRSAMIAQAVAEETKPAPPILRGSPSNKPLPAIPGLQKKRAVQ